MIFEATPLEGSFVITPEPRGDDRGWFVRTFCKEEFESIGHHKAWVQMNHSYTKDKGVIRGMHFQKPPHSEIKLVRCVRGAVWDVIVDNRNDSKTYLKWFGIVLSEQNKKMMYIPEGFAHGFQSLTENCELIYLHSEMYTPSAEDGLLYNDPALNIEWPLPLTHISQRDQSFNKIENLK